jgi:hypothetical protein
MGISHDDRANHEHDAALPAGTLTSTWSRDTAAFHADVGARICGRAGTGQHPPVEAGRTAAEDQCEQAHARPPLATTVPARVTELVDHLREETAELADHPRAARAVAQRLTAWSEHILWPPQECRLSPSGEHPCALRCSAGRPADRVLGGPEPNLASCSWLRVCSGRRPGQTRGRLEDCWSV